MGLVKIRLSRRSKSPVHVHQREHGFLHLNKSMLRAACLSVMLICLMASAFSQLNTADLRVVVKDAKGRVIPDANVTVLDQARGSPRTTSTDKDGQVVFRSLTPGLYAASIDDKIERPAFIEKGLAAHPDA